MSQPNDQPANDVATLVERGDWPGARKRCLELRGIHTSGAQRALAENDLGALTAASGDLPSAREMFAAAIAADDDCATARDNLALLDSLFEPSKNLPTESPPIEEQGASECPVRVAILSLLFNWPSTGGGTVHTAEAGKFLGRAGYEVRHIYAQFADWGLGNVTERTGVPSVPLVFDAASWNPDEIRRRFRAAVDEFSPDYVIITDSWNTKPLLAEAVHGYRYFIRLAALECSLSFSNNVRLLFEPGTGPIACPRQQLATPKLCRQCVRERQHQSGSLHQAERGLAGFDDSSYPQRLLQAFADAEGVLVVNPLIAAMVAPFAKGVHVVPSGFDPARFPWREPKEFSSDARKPVRLFFAGLIDEGMKGFRVLHEAAERLWAKRHDFEIVATADPVGRQNAFTQFIGWQSQEELPAQLREADMLIFPTIAEEALGRSAVEAMGAGIPVIASRIGGLPYTVTDGLTGLLFEPGNVVDLADKIARLLDDPELRRRMGATGRKRFETEFTWDVIIDKHYRRLLAPPASRGNGQWASGIAAEGGRSRTG